MNQEDKEFEKLKEVRKACLANAEDFIKSATKLKREDVEHLRYHLTTLALEEIGKATLMQMNTVAKVHRNEDGYSSAFEDHVKKLFWALWGPAFDKGKITKQDIDTYQGLASAIHDSRLLFLYVDPENPVHPKTKMKEKEAELLVGLAESRLKMEQARELVKPEVGSVEAEELRWFLQATDDPEKRKLIFGPPSIKKLMEYGEGKKWIHWLKEQFDTTEAEMKKFIEEELHREKPEGKEAQKAKWRIKIRINSESHSIRTKVLNEWNKKVSWIQLATNEKHDLICTFFLPKSFPITALWFVGWGMCRQFVVALNIATRGFFWWHVSKDRGRYYEEIWDLEKNAGVGIQDGPDLIIGWKDLHLTLKDSELALTSVISYFLVKIRNTELEKPFNHYALGITLTAKNDIHLRMETSAFEAFFQCFKSALLVSGDWDGKEDMKIVVKRVISTAESYESIYKYIDLGFELEKSQEKKTSFPITLTDVFGMKLWCDIYLTEFVNKKMKSEIQKVKEENRQQE